MGLQRGRTAGEPDDDNPDEVTVGMADGRKLVIKGLEPPVREEDLVEEHDEATVPPPEPDLNPINAIRWGMPGA